MNSLGTQLSAGAPVLPTALALSSSARWVIGVVGLVLIIVISAALTQLTKDPVQFPVTNVDVLGTVDYVDRAELKQIVNRYAGRGFYGLDIDDIRQSVEALEWIASARVSRVWPSRIEVHIEEHEPAARWNDDSLMSKRMVMFQPRQLQPDSPRYQQWRDVFAPLPQLRGADGRHSELLDSFRAYELELEPFGIGLKVLDEDERRSQSLELSNQVTVRLGYEDRELRLQRFVDVYPRFLNAIEKPVGESIEAATVTFDMRYSNGFALGGISGAQPLESLQLNSSRLVQRPLQ